jgi:hypothetical protein
VRQVLFLNARETVLNVTFILGSLGLFAQVLNDAGQEAARSTGRV